MIAGRRHERHKPADLYFNSLLATGRRAFSLGRFRSAGETLADVRSPADAQAVDIQLHERVRALRRGLPAGVQLVGALAGGRKTMSAALQAAFSLQASRSDRLVHTLLHPVIEEVSAERREAFVVPEPGWEVPEAEQVTLHDVWFPPLRELFAGAQVDGRPLVAWLDDAPYGQVVRRLGDAAQGAASAVLRRERRGWTYAISVGMHAEKTDLAGREAEALAALVALRGAATAGEIVDWRVQRGLIVEPATQDERERAENAARQAMRHLRKRLTHLVGRGLADLLPSLATGPERRYRLGGTVEVDWSGLHR